MQGEVLSLSLNKSTTKPPIKILYLCYLQIKQTNHFLNIRYCIQNNYNYVRYVIIFQKIKNVINNHSLFLFQFIVTKEKMACLKTGYFPFEKQTNCSEALLKCELTKTGKLRGFVYRCPDDFVYWNISRRCEPLKKVRDCKRSTYPWKRRFDIPLEKFNIATET